MTTPFRKSALLSAMALATLMACQPAADSTVTPVEIGDATSCALDGMLLADYPGPKAQIHFANQNEPEFFCDTIEMFSVLLNPEQVRKVTGVFVQDMGATDWTSPKGAWIDARKAFYVMGSSKKGSMGPTYASFADKGAAEKFAAEHGGHLMLFSDFKPDMAKLDGGALHDSHM
jgi:copper chaperone NosL